MNSNFNNNFKSSHSTLRDGFTLIELLFVVAIIAVLATMSVGILGKAQADAKRSATRSRITRIEAIMQTVTDDFEVRRLPFRTANLQSQFPNITRNQVKNFRRRYSAALLQAEYPGPSLNPSDGTFSTNSNIGQVAPAGSAPVGSSRTDNLNFRGWLDSLGGNFTAFVAALPPTAEQSYWQNLSGNANLDQPGEYLYIILQRLDIDGRSALDTLGPSVIGNPDNDMFPDVVDAFGDSMQLRIVQVQAMPTQNSGSGLNETWTDIASGLINWKQSGPLGTTNIQIPKGYELLNPAIPRSIGKIRFQVISPNLEEI